MFIHVAIHGILVLLTSLLFFALLFVTGVTLFEAQPVLNNLPDVVTIGNLFIAWVVSFIALLINFCLFSRNITR